jgi:hypothetical protein
MKLRLFLTIFTSLSLIIILNACGTTDYYKDRAVRRARKFLLEEDRTLTLAQREYVKFNKPVIMGTSIFKKLGTESATSGTLSHVCIAWIAPGRKNAHVVFGASDNRLRDWTPNRVIIKRYDKPAYKYHAARRAAMLYGVSNLLYLSNRQLNRIRFEVPETIVTDYKLPKANLKEKSISEKQLKSLVQITFVWSSGRPSHKVFVCGVGAKDLGGWRPIFGGETPVSELRDHYLGPVAFGQFAPIPEEYKKNVKVKTPKVKTPKVKTPKVKTPKVKEPKLEEVKK